MNLYMKDAIHDIARILELSPEVDENAAFDSLANAINNLLVSNPDKMISILYRLDVSDEKIKFALQKNPGEDAGKLIAQLMIERQKARIRARKEFGKGNDPTINENEKW